MSKSQRLIEEIHPVQGGHWAKFTNVEKFDLEGAPETEELEVSDYYPVEFVGRVKEGGWKGLVLREGGLVIADEQKDFSKMLLTKRPPHYRLPGRPGLPGLLMRIAYFFLGRIYP